jgi:hypothetical protein
VTFSTKLTGGPHRPNGRPRPVGPLIASIKPPSTVRRTGPLFACGPHGRECAAKFPSTLADVGLFSLEGGGSANQRCALRNEGLQPFIIFRRPASGQGSQCHPGKLKGKRAGRLFRIIHRNRWIQQGLDQHQANRSELACVNFTDVRNRASRATPWRSPDRGPRRIRRKSGERLPKRPRTSLPNPQFQICRRARSSSQAGQGLAWAPAYPGGNAMPPRKAMNSRGPRSLAWMSLRKQAIVLAGGPLANIALAIRKLMPPKSIAREA